MGLVVATAREVLDDAAGVVRDAVVELDLEPAGRLTVGVGVADVVPVLVAVRRAVGTSRGPVPDRGTTRVATMVECVLGSALETPTHMLYPVSSALAALV